MIKVRKALGVLALALLLSACEGGRKSPSFPPPEEPVPSAEEGESQREEVQNSLAHVVLESEALTGFVYCADEPYTQIWNGGLIPDMGVSSARFICSKAQYGPRAEAEGAFVDDLAVALARIAVDPESKTLMAEGYPLPGGEYIGFWLTLGEWEPFLYLFASGDLYLEANGRPERSAYHYKLEDTADYGVLAGEMEKMEDAVNHMPLDYNFDFSTWLDQFRPESEAVKLFLYNRGGRVVQFSSRFIVEREVDGQWREVEEIEPVMEELQEVPPREFIRWSINLTNLREGRAPGRYRVTGQFSYRGEEAQALHTEYEISEDAVEVSYPLPSSMTPENAVYCERYIQMWGFYNPFLYDFDEGGYPANFHTYHLFYLLSSMEGLSDGPGRHGDLPAEMVESVIARHFNVTPEQIRALSYTQVQRPSEYYDPQRESYHFEGGYGGGSLTGIVTGSSREEELLTLTCRWYGMDDAFQFENTVTLWTGPGDTDFVYIQNQVTEHVDGVRDFSGME